MGQIFDLLGVPKKKYRVYLLIYWTAKNNYFGNCPGIIGTYFYRACEVSGIIRTSKQAAACELAKFNRTVCD